MLNLRANPFTHRSVVLGAQSTPTCVCDDGGFALALFGGGIRAPFDKAFVGALGVLAERDCRSEEHTSDSSHIGSSRMPSSA